MEYIGEHLWAGNLGRLSVIITFTSALYSLIAYILAEKNPNVWKSAARAGFVFHAVGVFATVGTLFFIMGNHYYEYDYAWKHTSNDLPPRFLFSAFWEGQEGSFLLWMFWHAVLGLLFLRVGKNWEGPVLGTIALVQAFLASMLLGIYVFGMKIGSNPFVLIRQLPENLGLNWTEMPDYLERFPGFWDGSGLNPLLQNYWMTIHPPVLFLGFASTLIPFSFAIGALLRNDYKSWVKPALPWTFFSVGILGLGILMGGAWAYEALSFGGFWAWDPVENSSLVPWIVMVGAGHLLLIERYRGGVIRSTLLFTMLSFLLVLYSTFLTRSGVLGDSSVHSFVDLGLSGQLLLYLLTFVVIAFLLFFAKMGKMPKSNNEEQFDSREFWMFTGQMVLLISAFQITISTSIPVINKIIGPDGGIPMLKEALAPPTEAIKHYNSLQIPFAIAITLLMGFTYFFNYKRTPSKIFVQRLLLSFGVALVLTMIVQYSFDFNFINSLLLFTGLFATTTAVDYWVRLTRRSAKTVGSAMAHFGFGLLIIGALISQGKKEVISSNENFIHKDFPSNENMLMELGDTSILGNYKVTWTGERQEGHHKIYTLHFLDGFDKKQFELEPFIQLNERMGNVAEPSTKHWLTKDLYTHLTYADLRTEEEKQDGWLEKGEFEISTGDTIIASRRFVILDSLAFGFESSTGDETKPDMLMVGAHLSVITMLGDRFTANPILSLDRDAELRYDSEIDTLGLKFSFHSVNPDSKKVIIKYFERDDEPPFIILKAIVFPYINLLWLGCIIMTLGAFMSVYQRIKRNRKRELPTR